MQFGSKWLNMGKFPHIACKSGGMQIGIYLAVGHTFLTQFGEVQYGDKSPFCSYARWGFLPIFFHWLLGSSPYWCNAVWDHPHVALLLFGVYLILLNCRIGKLPLNMGKNPLIQGCRAKTIYHNIASYKSITVHVVLLHNLVYFKTWCSAVWSLPHIALLLFRVYPILLNCRMGSPPSIWGRILQFRVAKPKQYIII
jgi:hypothetical protein